MDEQQSEQPQPIEATLESTPVVPCPHCGYCPTCGRSNQFFWPIYPTAPNQSMPVVQPYPTNIMSDGSAAVGIGYTPGRCA